MNRNSSAKKVNSFLEHMANEKTKRTISLPFLSGFSRQMPTKHIEIVRNEDELTSLFNKIQSQIDKLTSLEDSTLEINSRKKQSTLTRAASISRVIDDSEDLKGSFGVEIESSGTLSVGSVKEQKYYSIKNHLGDISGLINFLNYKKLRSKSSLKSVTPWSGNKLFDNAFETSSHVSFMTLKTFTSNHNNNNNDSIQIDIKLLYDYKFLIQFCFKSLGKTGPDCPKLPEGFQFFKIINDDPITIYFTNQSMTYTIDDILSKFFSFIAKSVLKCVGHKARKLVIAVPAEYGILEKTELKRAVERADLEILRILSSPIARAVVIGLREQRDSNFNDKVGKHVVIDLSPGALNVTLYETNMFKPLKVTSSLLNQNYSSTSLKQEFFELIKEKISQECAKDLEHNTDLLEKYINEIDLNMKKEHLKESIVLSTIDDETFSFKKIEIDNLIQNYTNQAIKLLNAILTEQNICKKNEIKRIDIFSSIFSNTIGSLIKTKCGKIVDQKNIFIEEKDKNSIMNIAKIARKMAGTGKDYLDSSLSSSLGTGDYRGIFFKHLKRGLTLPCSETTTTTTIYDNQESLLVEIFQGERPLTRYCALLGSLNVTNLPLDKAEKVLIEVTLSIDKDEVLTVKAKELKTNKKLSVIIEKAELKLNVDNMVIEAIENKLIDEKLVSKLNELDKLIESIRKKYINQNRIMDKMNDIIDRITEQEQTIDINGCDQLLNEIKEFINLNRKQSIIINKNINNNNS